MINIEQFSQIEIRAGKILSVEYIEGADKLLKLSVDMGEETPRQILSGIRLYFEDPIQALTGITCGFVANLEPRVIRGLESQGMILGVSDTDGNFSLLTIDSKILPGTRVK